MIDPGEAFELLTGRRAPKGFLDRMGEVRSVAELRKRLLHKPQLWGYVPELRMAHEIQELRKARLGGEVRLIIGAAGTTLPGWVATNRHTLDLLNPRSWLAFLEPDSVTTILAEHVWEHLDAAEGRRAAATCLRYLKPGGRLRLAVPDALHPDPAYRAYAGMEGPHRHKIFYDHAMMAEALERVGFRVEKLEYWTEAGEFVGNPWDPAEGRITRSRWNDKRNADGKPNFTSLIVDGIKPG